MFPLTEPDDHDLYKEYVSHRFGRNVDRLDELDVENVEPWRKKFFGLCRKSLNLDDENLYVVPVSQGHQIRAKSGTNTGLFFRLGFSTFWLNWPHIGSI